MDELAQRLKNMTPLQRAVFALRETQARLDALEKKRVEPIAIVGMACRFPGGVCDPASYWRLLCDRVDAVRETPADRWDVDAFYDPDPAAHGKMNSRWGGFLDHIDEFDNHFFGISDREALRLDPQQRMLLELAWEALEDAGIPPATLRGSRTGVFVGISISEYGIMLSTDLAQTDAHAAAGTSLCLAANRLSFTFGLQGPSLALDTACSSALVAVHLACQNIRAGECDAALAGGANLILSPIGTINLTKAGFCAADGRVRAFDAAASGYVRGEGAGLLLLKPLAAALKNNDPVYAVIRGSAVNQNGSSNGVTAPSRAAQEQVLREAYARAQRSPGRVQFVETQGTGTRLGDAIEALALGNVLGEGRPPGSRCAIGSVKTNIGHLETASGAASLMKAALALQHRQIPANLHFHTPNPDIPFDALPLRVPQSLEPWPDDAEPRIAGVSAFGFGGSNAHLVLEEAPQPSGEGRGASGENSEALRSAANDRGDASPAAAEFLLPLSARTEKALEALLERYRKYLQNEPPPWRDVCYTAAARRDHHDCRLAVLADSHARAVELLGAHACRGHVHASVNTPPVNAALTEGEPAPSGLFRGRKPYGRSLKVAFVYDGRAENWKALLPQLPQSVPGFAAAAVEVDAALARIAGCSLASLRSDDPRWGDPAFARPALLALQLALTAWWRHAGLAADVVLGQGVGEWAAACAAGILTVDEALRIAVACGRGDGAALGGVELRRASLPFLSTVDGQGHPGPDLAASHWERCLVWQAETSSRETPPHCNGGALASGRNSSDDARCASPGLAAAVKMLVNRHVDICLEIGPRSLTELLTPLLGANGSAASAIPALAPGAAGAGDVLTAVGGLYAAGADIVWERLAPAAGRSVRVPGYPWQRQRLWAPTKKWLPAVVAKSASGAAGTGMASGAPTDVPQTPPPGPPPAVEVRTRPDLTTPYAAPRTELERTMARLWSESLHIDRVGIHDNFFEVGGDSLQAAILLNQLPAAVGRQFALPLRDVFEARTIAALASRIEAALQGDGAALACIPQIPRQRELPLSLNQESLWFLSRLEPGRPSYMLYLAINVKGPISIPTLERALNEIARRHEILRTRFPEVDGRPVQVIEPPQARSLPVIDLSHLPEPQRERELRRKIAEQMCRPIDLENGPLLRVVLLRRGENDYAVAASLHHIIHDGWSVGVALGELAALYPALLAGRASPLPELPIQFVDYAAWQRDLLQGETLQRLQSYWHTQLEGVPPLELPTDFPRPPVRTTRGSSRRCQLSAETSAAVLEFCRREGATPFMVLLAAFEVLLARYSGQDDFAVGSPMANRSRPELELLIGYLVNVIVLRAGLGGDPSFREAVTRARQVALEAFAHQELTLDQVVNAVQPRRDLSRNPIFQVMFALHNLQLPPVPGIELQITPLDDCPAPPAANFDLTLELFQTEQGFQGSLNFSTDLFDPQTIERMIGQYQVLVAAAVREPQRSIAALPLLDDAERRQMVVQGSGAARPYDRTRLVHRLFEAQAERSPDAPAVVSGDERWSYGELNARANQLARYLRRQGVGPEVRVGICLDRSPELLLAVLAVLKAGGAYVPLDPAYTRVAEERLKFVLADAQVSLLLTDATWPDAIDAAAKRIVLGAEAQQGIGREEAGNLEDLAAAEHLAYILYTSGSTGRPKGVMVTQGNLLSAYHGWQETYRLDAEVRAHLQMASFSFDVFAGDLLRALCSGGKLVICRKEILLDPAELLGLMRREQVDFAEFVPIVLRNLVEYLEETGQSLDFMRLVVAGSDAWYAADHRRTQRVLGPRTRLLNSYGLTETTIDSSCFEGDVGLLADADLVPIGRPLPNVRMYVLDERMQPAPIGVPGQLYIGGDGVSRGYVNADLNAARFLKDPFADAADARLCRSGDRARWRGDGQLEFLGRADNQVKIRGYRIEPGEVEQLLREHPSVAGAAVVARERSAGDLRLVAYLVGKSGTTPDAAALKPFLAQRLPEYMIPAAFVPLAALPATASGKVDRKALPEPDWEQAAARDFVPPRGPVEQQLAEIWSEIFGVERIGAGDDFFELGGNSLLSLRLMARVRKAFDVELSLVQFFTSPTIADLATAVDTIRKGAGAETMPRSAPATMLMGTPSRTAAALRGASFVNVEHQPLEELIPTKCIEPIDAAALGYWPGHLLDFVPAVRELLAVGWLVRRPLLYDVRQTPWGRMGVIMLPIFDSELYDDPERMVRLTIDGLDLAGSLGARFVSLTGLIPSATQNGRALVAAMGNRHGLPRPTTGHATTAATVVLSLRRALDEAGRTLAAERVAYLGLGSVGSATLRLMISALPHPREIILSDLFSKRDALCELKRELIERFDFQGDVRVVSSAGPVPDELYEATTIVAATNVAEVMAVERMRPATLIVDDSGPHSFSTRAAIERFETSADILFTEGGVLKSPQPISQSRYLPRGLETLVAPDALRLLTAYDPRRITGCMLSGLLSARFDEVQPTIGPVRLESLTANLEKLTQLGFEAADLHCDDYRLPEEHIRRFKNNGLQMLAAKQPAAPVVPSPQGGCNAHASSEHALASVNVAPIDPALTEHPGAPPKLDLSTIAPSLLPLRREGAGPPLFLIHGLGGHATAFVFLARAMAADCPVYGIQAQGLEAGQEPHDCIESMATFYLREIRAVQPHGPYCLGGWSMGGLVAWEAARQMAAAGESVALLALLDTYLSLADFQRLDLDDQTVLRWIAPHLKLSAAELKPLPLERQWERIEQQAMRVEGVGVVEIRRLAAVCKAHLAALRRYVPQPYPGPSLLVTADQGRTGRDGKWHALLPRLRVEAVPGDHYTMLRDPAVAALARRLDAYLQEILAAEK